MDQKWEIGHVGEKKGVQGLTITKIVGDTHDTLESAIAQAKGLSSNAVAYYVGEGENQRIFVGPNSNDALGDGLMDVGMESEGRPTYEFEVRLVKPS
ncbi:MAG: hypothetical protein Q7K33_01620 [Candidatus Berkelbacteria bacterium]|nr:hypothetical protein [Candidatus Berkelbacteria bacterium]